MKAAAISTPLIAGIVGAAVAVVGGELVSSAFGELNVALKAAIGFIPGFLLAKLLAGRRSGA